MGNKKILPENWCSDQVGNLMEFEYGKGLIKKSRNQNGKYFVFGSNGIIGKHSEYLIRNPCIIIGRKGAVGEIHISKYPCWPIDTTYYLRNSDIFDLTFLYYQLKTLRLSNLDKSTAIPGLNRNDAYKKKLFIPPLPEQRRIIDKIEELFSELDKGVEALKTAQQKLTTYRQAVLKCAFEGKLTEEWREQKKDLPNSDEALKKIKAEGDGIAQADGNKIKRIEEVNASGISKFSVLPKGWCWTRIDSFLSLNKKGMTTGPFGTALKKSDHKSQGVPVFGIENIENGRFINRNKIFVSEEKARELSAFRVCANEIIISRSGTVGELCAIPPQIDSGLISTNLIRVALNLNAINPSFFVFMFQGESILKNQIKDLCKGSTRIFLNQDILSRIIFPMASLAEQGQIIREIESRLSVADKLEEVIDSSLKKSEALRHSILKKAFEGKLVPQDPNDEPASLLLERIKAERTVRDLKINNKKKACYGR